MRYVTLRRMTEAVTIMAATEAGPEVVAEAKKQSWASLWQTLRWSPTSRQDIIASEQRLLTLVKTPYVQEQVNIGSGPPGSRVRWFRSTSNEPRFINTVTFENPTAPTLVMVHGYGASQGFFFRNFDALAHTFSYTCNRSAGVMLDGVPNINEFVLPDGGHQVGQILPAKVLKTESWFVDSLEEWRKAKKLQSFILLGHSLGGYVAARYALKHPEHVQHLVLVGSAGFSPESDRFMQFRSTWRGALANFIWESNLTPQSIIRSLGPWGPNLVRKYAAARFGTYASGNTLNEKETKLLSDYMYHTLAARASGELCLKYIFSLGAFARSPLITSASDWKVPTSFIYGVEDWMDYRGAQEARKHMNVPTELFRVPQSGHFVFLDNASDFHSTVLYACRQYLPGRAMQELPEELIEVSHPNNI